jgi:Hypervirulence associated proteins TUDOR domain
VVVTGTDETTNATRGKSFVAQNFEQGDRVKWNTPQGETHGKVNKKLTSSTEVGG